MTELNNIVNNIIPFLNSNIIYLAIVIFVFFLVVNVLSSSFKILKLSLFAIPISFLLSKTVTFLASQGITATNEQIKNLFGYIQEKGLPSEQVIFIITFGLIIFSKSKLLGMILIIIGFILGLVKSILQVNNPMDIVMSIAIGIISIFAANLLMKLFHLSD